MVMANTEHISKALDLLRDGGTVVACHTALVDCTHGVGRPN